MSILIAGRGRRAQEGHLIGGDKGLRQRAGSREPASSGANGTKRQLSNDFGRLSWRSVSFFGLRGRAEDRPSSPAGPTDRYPPQDVQHAYFVGFSGGADPWEGGQQAAIQDALSKTPVYRQRHALESR